MEETEEISKCRPNNMTLWYWVPGVCMCETVPEWSNTEEPTRCNNNNLLISSTCFGQSFAHLQERKAEIFTAYGMVSCCCGRQGFGEVQRGTTINSVTCYMFRPLIMAIVREVILHRTLEWLTNTKCEVLSKRFKIYDRIRNIDEIICDEFANSFYLYFVF